MENEERNAARRHGPARQTGPAEFLFGLDIFFPHDILWNKPTIRADASVEIRRVPARNKP